MKGSEIRSKFLDFFRAHGHEVVGSASLIPHQDPTLLFINAGMVPFKRVFTGDEKRGYKRAASVQKCLRVSGKHNDLENVGRTPRHHTFFEMLGNFSFGDYFKEDAIRYGWEFLTGTLGIDPGRLWITVFREDDEAAGVWRDRIGVPAERITRMDEEDNFWAMGDTGPCGPCSEIHFEMAPPSDPARSGFLDDPERFMEIWNLVFMQYDRDASGVLNPLPKPSIDTGMGLERVAAVMQGAASNFETDLFRPVIAFVEEASGKRYGESEQFDVSMRVIADHARAITFLVTDGVTPSNEGRGYVLRRILRRASRHAQILGVREPLLHQATGVVVRLMRSAYPDLVDRADLVSRVTRREEERFLVTLEKGLEILETELARLSKAGERTVPGDLIFKLYDTYGFPVDLTEDIARDKEFSTDGEGFIRAMEEQRERARKAWRGSREKVAPAVFTRDGSLASEFRGYDALSLTSRIKAMFVEKASAPEPCPAAREGEKVEIITEATPFYGEGGGQVGDTGLIFSDAGEAEVVNTTHPVPGVTVHHARVKRGVLTIGDEVNLVVHAERRTATMLNHSGTHLFHAALRETLGDHVRQAGSLVAPDRLRFDFTHFAPMSRDEIRQVESLVNDEIRRNLTVEHCELPYREAIERGALAFFGDKYPDVVRVVQMGDFSLELCGGTHVTRTGEIGFFKIGGESGIAADTRRIEAVTGTGAYDLVRETEARLAELGDLLKSSPREVVEKVTRALDSLREAQAEIESSRSHKAQEEAVGILEQAFEVKGAKAVVAEVQAPDQKALREIGDKIRQKFRSGVIVLGSRRGDKASLLVTVSDDLVKRFHAGKIVKELAERLGGRGGGRPDRAEAGGSKPEALSAVLERAVTLLEEQASG
ncbi:MAG: alanine--tRNA ligase [Deltaproteobacteria bacterium]|nr:alanine--tRNA ligase [Deltaproteobacteria bacterium]